MRITVAATAIATTVAASAVFLNGCASDQQAALAPELTPTPTAAGAAPDDSVFMTQIKPILELRCLECHNDKDAGEYAGLSLQTRKAAMTTGRSGGVLKPGDPDGSLLLRVLSYGHDHPIGMPPSPDKLWDDKKKLIHDWIEDGADWPEPPRGRLVRPQDVWG